MARLSCMNVVGPALPSRGQPCAAWNLLTWRAARRPSSGRARAPARRTSSPSGSRAVDERPGRSRGDRRT
jgi:hypothetical protein